MIGGSMRAYIAETNLSPGGVATAAGISLQELEDILTDKKSPSPELYFRLCMCMGVTLDFFRKRPRDAN